jgi:hypothetical protein
MNQLFFLGLGLVREQKRIYERCMKESYFDLLHPNANGLQIDEQSHIILTDLLTCLFNRRAFRIVQRIDR